MICEQLCDYLETAGLLDGVEIQTMQWRDDGDNLIYAVFRPNGGSNIKQDLGNDYGVRIDLIAPNNDPKRINKLTCDIVSFLVESQFNNGLGLISIINGIPEPVFTVDNRIVYRLQVSIKS